MFREDNELELSRIWLSQQPTEFNREKKDTLDMNTESIGISREYLRGR